VAEILDARGDIEGAVAMYTEAYGLEPSPEIKRHLDALEERAAYMRLPAEYRALPDEAITLDYVVDSLVVCGTVNSVVDQLLAFRERIGDFGTLLYAGHDWVDPDLSKRSMELMASEVMPRINAAIAKEAAEELPHPPPAGR